MKLRTLIRKVKNRAATEASGLYDRLLFQMGIAEAVPIPEGDGPLLLYMGERYQHHVPRVARWVIRRSNWRTLMMCHRHYFPKKYDASVYDSKATFRNVWHFRRQLMFLRDKVDLVHAFGPYSLYPGILRKETDVPILADLKDVNLSYFGFEPPAKYSYYRPDFPHEKYLLEHATGIIASSFEGVSAFREYDIEQRPPSLFFPIYADSDDFTDRSGVYNPDEIHVVYVGGVAGSHRDRGQFGIIQFAPFIEKFSAQKIHFHLYPAPSTAPEDYEEYKAIDARDPYFHFHNSVPQSQLADEIAKYDYGWLGFFLEDSERRPHKLNNETSVKIFNYFESGLPVIISEDLHFQVFMAKRYGAAVEIRKDDLSRLGEILRARDFEATTRTLKARREELSVRNQVERLLHFYNRFSRTPAEIKPYQPD